MKIYIAQKGVAAQYAAGELKKYIELVTGDVVPEIVCCDVLPDRIEDGELHLGLLEEFGLPCDDLKDPVLEDILYADIENLTGILAGSNIRSILMTVYRYMHSAGCRFIRPGKDGEYIPHCDLYHHSFRYRKKADSLFRGECSEGAISYEHMRDTVYWLPKVGMNMYMIEGLVPYTYMHKWYGHIANTRLRIKRQVTDYDFLAGKIALLEQDIVRTGIQLHNVGHGWMFEKLSVHHGNSAYEQKALREEDKQYLALVNGKRDLMHGSTFYTHFCYSNPAARKILVDFCVEYIRKKPYVDFLHVWLADAANNQCECDECVKMTPSDHYVQLLNELDVALEHIESKTRIVFILYVDTVRPPEKLRLRHPERFILLAAIGQFYNTGYVEEPYRGEIPPYQRNRWTPPSNSLRLLWHRQWKELCGGIPSCIFEYRFYTDQYCDPGYMQIARETYRDMRTLESVGFQGNMSDQTSRAFLPTSLPMSLLGETLFDHSLDYESYCRDYFLSAFGEDGTQVRDYLEKVTELFSPASLRLEGQGGVEEQGLQTSSVNAVRSWYNNPDYAARVAGIPALVRAFQPLIRKNTQSDDPCRRLSWKYLSYHAEIITQLSECYRLGALADLEGAAAKYLKLVDYLSDNEPEIHEVFDLFLFDRYTRSKFSLPCVPYYD